MIHCRLTDIYKPRYAVIWMLLSLKAGYLNAAGFLATGKFVSHVTGFGTQMGVSIAHEDYLFGIELLVIPIAFVLGSSVPAWILDWKYSSKSIPKYPVVQFLITLSLGVLLYLGTSGHLGEFSTIEDDEHDILLVGILCFICGMKNGLTTWATFGKIRTTHLTGLSTDMGLNLPKIFRKKGEYRFPEMASVNTIRLATFLSFSAGSLISAFVFPHLGYSGFIFPFVLSLYFLLISSLNYIRWNKKIKKDLDHEINNYA